MYVQKVKARYTIVNINIIMLSIYDILMCIIHLNGLELQECAVFVLGICQVPTSVFKVKQAAAEKRAPIHSKAYSST